MARVLVWDWPVRLFHWALAGGIVLAFAIGKLGDKDGAAFPYHAMIGLALGAMLVLRLLWGFIGTRYARFASFLFSPGEVARYLRGVATGDAGRHVGHNPGSSWAIFAIFAGLAAVVGSGVMLSTGNEAFEEIHEVAVYALLAVAAAHVAGVAIHTLRHRENITLGMITGRKSADPQAAIRSAAPVQALLLVALMALLAVALVRSYDPSTRRLAVPFAGTSLALGEGADDRGARVAHHRADDDD